TVPTGDVSLAYYEIAARKTFHVIANSIENADELVTDRHWHRNRLLRPGVPIVDVNVSAADGSFQHPDEHVITVHFRNRNFLEPQPGLRLGLHNGLHHLLHWERLSTDFADSHRFISKNCEIDLHFKTLPRWTVAGSLFPVREMPGVSRVEIVEEHS